MKEYILALDCSGSLLKCGLFDGLWLISGSYDSQPIDPNGSFEEIHSSYFSILNRARNFAMLNGFIIKEVSVDAPAPFDYKNGVSWMSHKYLAIKNKPLIPVIRAHLGKIKIRFMPDSFAFIKGAALGLEYSRYAGVTIGTGLSFAIMIDGNTLKCKNGAPLHSIYSLPYRKGNVEDVISGRGIVTAYNERANTPVYSARIIGERAASGDTLAISVYCDMAAALAEVITPLLSEYNIEALLLGGQISRSFFLFGNTLKDKLSSLPALCYIAPARDIDLAHLVGAAIGN